MDGNIFPGDLRLWLNDWRDPIQIGQIDTVCLPTTRLVWPKVPEIGESVRINRHHAHSVVYFVNFSLPLRRSGIKFHISNESLHDCVRVCHLREYFIPYLIFWLETKIPNLIRSHFHNWLFVQSKIFIFQFCCNHLWGVFSLQLLGFFVICTCICICIYICNHIRICACVPTCEVCPLCSFS